MMELIHLGITSAHSLEQPLPPRDPLTLRPQTPPWDLRQKASFSGSVCVPHPSTHEQAEQAVHTFTASLSSQPKGADQATEIPRPTQTGRENAKPLEMESRLLVRGRELEPGLGGAQKKRLMRISLSLDQAGSS